MQLAVLSAVLMAIAASEGGGGPVAGVSWRLVVVAAASLAAPLAALIGSQRLVSVLPGEGADDSAASRLETLVMGLWLGAVIVMLFVAQWPRIVRDNWQLAGWPLVDELAVLLPVLAPLLLMWAALYRLERAAQVNAYQAAGWEPPPARLLGHLWSQARHHLGLVLLPPLAIVGLLEVLGRFGVAATNLDAAWWLVIPLLVTMLVLMPAAVRRIWRTTPLEAGELRDELERICTARRCVVRDIRVWHTDGTMANAAVVGLSRHLRSMLLTDALLRRLTNEQIAAVARHELAHLRRWHLPLRLALLLVPVFGWLAAQRVWPDLESLAVALSAGFGSASHLASVIALPAGMLAYAVLVVGWYSRLLEHDADLDACQADDGQFDAAGAGQFVAALTTLTGRSRESRWSHWMHPPLVDRLRFIERLAADGAFALVFRRRLALLTGLLVAFYLAAAVALVSL
jgi:Zn-dependent protease with chaperone function